MKMIKKMIKFYTKTSILYAMIMLVLMSGCDKSKRYDIVIENTVVTEESDEATNEATEKANSELTGIETEEDTKTASGVISEDGFSELEQEESDLDGSEESCVTEDDNASNETAEGERLIHVYICGAVKNEGVYEVPYGTEVYSLLLLAGGYSEDAELGCINLAKKVHDGEKIYFPYKGTIKNPAAYDSSLLEETTGQEGYETQTESNEIQSGSGLVNINTATVSELMKLPGIGEVKANSIVSYRDSVGGFQSIEDLKKVSGIKSSTYDNIKNLITVN